MRARQSIVGPGCRSTRNVYASLLLLLPLQLFLLLPICIASCWQDSCGFCCAKMRPIHGAATKTLLLPPLRSRIVVVAARLVVWIRRIVEPPQVVCELLCGLPKNTAQVCGQAYWY